MKNSPNHHHLELLIIRGVVVEGGHFSFSAKQRISTTFSSLLLEISDKFCLSYTQRAWSAL